VENNVDAAVELALRLAVTFEGVYLKPYLDPVGIPTQGIGCTRHLDGRPVLMTDTPVTRDYAIAWARQLLQQRFTRAVLGLCPAADTAPRLGALVDFAFNLGEGRLRGSTLRKRVNARRWADVPTELLKWDMAGGRHLPGLTRRRAAEAQLVTLG
jgi:lysozyme